MSFEAAVHAKAVELDIACLEMCHRAGSGHPTSAMSLGHIMTVLLYHTMRWVPDQPHYVDSDRLVLSEGHAVPIVYAALADVGGVVGKPGALQPVTQHDLDSLRELDSPLDGHPNPQEGVPFFDAATGSLGQGLSVAAGLGLAARRDGLRRRIYCLIGDGEAREGQVAEALDFIVDHRLTNVLPIINCNGYGQADQVSDRQSPEVMAGKLEAYGLTVRTIDGHDPGAIREALEAFVSEAQAAGPMAIVARTVKGWGAPAIQGGGWHGKPPEGEKLDKAIEELRESSVRLTSSMAADELRIYPPEPIETPQVTVTAPMGFREAMGCYDMATVLSTGAFATRKAYGLALRALGHADSRVYALDADVRNSTFSEWFGNDKDLSDRFVECKIAEQNMFSVAAGLSAAGKIPFASTFSKFVARGYDQIEMAINSGANFKIVGSHSGVTPAADGPSQMALPDVAWFRSWTTVRNHHGNPACYLLQPADAYAAYALTLAMAEYEGFCYMRTARPDVEFIYDESAQFHLGGLEVLTEGRDLLIVSAGYMVHECNKALQRLDDMGIDASLVDMYCLPFDRDKLLDLANANGGNILSVEDNYGGGLGAAVADAVTESGDGFTIEQMHVRRIPKSARTIEEVLTSCGLGEANIAGAAAKMLGVVGV